MKITDSLEIINNFQRKISSDAFYKQKKIRIYLNFIRWKIRFMLFPNKSYIFPWFNSISLRIFKGSKGTSGNAYLGLNDPEEMSFLLHFLKPENIFYDIGANNGAYTVLAASLDSKVIAIEPVSDTIECLRENVKVNNLTESVKIIRKAVGKENKTVRITTIYDCKNKLLRDSDYDQTYEEVELVTLDSLHADSTKNCVCKIDVEGFELDVLKGAKEFLTHNCDVVIIENEKEEIRNLLKSFNFFPITYDFSRKKINLDDGCINRIYIKDLKFCNQRLREKTSNFSIHPIRTLV